MVRVLAFTLAALWMSTASADEHEIGLRLSPAFAVVELEGEISYGAGAHFDVGYGIFDWLSLQAQLGCTRLIDVLTPRSDDQRDIYDLTSCRVAALASATVGRTWGGSVGVGPALRLRKRSDRSVVTAGNIVTGRPAPDEQLDVPVLLRAAAFYRLSDRLAAELFVHWEAPEASAELGLAVQFYFYP